ncbi:helix-turn-helix domain-containing protein [Stenotrophomonas rhizophila]|uniref:helix-turn-helix domain-containing protein n=1 Tax=Stenotrophomonas rhizophila TaxID=216778 RepID=UPI0028B188C4|nr:helix-turn-helix domain-containing protein [Stenotrophomonas rhizophila]
MSGKVYGMVFDRYPVGGGEMLLALALADHAHDDGTHIFPSIARLAQKTRQSERSVQYQLRRMEASGWLVLVNAGLGGRRSGFGEGGRTRQYRVNPEWMKGADFAPFEKGAKEGSEGCKTASERVQKRPSKGATAIAPEPKATKSNQKQHSLRERGDEADAGQLTEREVDAALAGFGTLPPGIDREMLARFTRHRGACRRPLSVQGWLQVRTALQTMAANGHDINESLRQTMAAGLALPVIPIATPAHGATHATPHHGSADHVTQLREQCERDQQQRQHGGGGDAGGTGILDAEFSVVG